MATATATIIPGHYCEGEFHPCGESHNEAIIVTQFETSTLELRARELALARAGYLADIYGACRFELDGVSRLVVCIRQPQEG